MRLNNYYIDNRGRKTDGGLEGDKAFEQYRAFRVNDVAVALNGNGVPEDLVGSGHHRQDHFRIDRSGIKTIDLNTPMR